MISSKTSFNFDQKQLKKKGLESFQSFGADLAQLSLNTVKK